MALQKRAGDEVLVNFDFSTLFGSFNAARHIAFREALRAIMDATTISEAFTIANDALNNDNDSLGKVIVSIENISVVPAGSLTVGTAVYWNFSGLVAQTPVFGGVIGQCYSIVCTVRLDDGELLTLDGAMEIVP